MTAVAVRKRAAERKISLVQQPFAFRVLFFLFVDSVLQSLANFENRRFRSSDLDCRTSLRVAAHASGALLDLKGAETNQLNLFTLGEGTADSVDKAFSAFSAFFLES